MGLATLARDTLPESGQTILATVLAAVVVFELVGPLGVQWAVKHVGESSGPSEGHPLTLEEAIKELQTRKARIVAVIDSKSDGSILEVPRLLAARFTADLTIIPVCGGVSPGTGWWLPEESVECGLVDGLDALPDVAGSPTTEVIHAPVVVSSGALDTLLEILLEHSPDILLVSTAGQSAGLLGAANEVRRRLGCPVLEIPLTQPQQAVRPDLGTRATAAVEGLAGLWRRARGQLPRVGRAVPVAKDAGGASGAAPSPEAPSADAPPPDVPAAEGSPLEAPQPEASPPEAPPPGGGSERDLLARIHHLG